MRLTLIATAIWIGLASQGVAQEDRSILAFDARSCHDWNSPSEVNPKQALQDWTLHYLTGLTADGAFRADATPQVVASQAFAWIDGYCERRPLDGLSTAALEFMNELTEHPKAPD